MAESIEAFKDQIRVSDVVGRWVALKRSGSGVMKGLCPFHQERTPSFTVTNTRGTYKCFGCDQGGDAIDFVMAMTGCEFRDAVDEIAKITGVEAPQRRAPREDPNKPLYAANETATKWFHHLLTKTEHGAGALSYLYDRGIDDSLIERYQIGYAPRQREVALQILGKKGHSADVLVASGLLIRPEDGGVPFARFRDRVMFPIWDAKGRAVGFSGRALNPKAKAKYLNTPETPIFRKGHLLYGHHIAKEPARQAGSVVVTEGCVDVIACARAGLSHAVAPLGTAITPEQVKALWSLADCPIVALDGDNAGIRAGRRLVDTAFPLMTPGKSLRFALLPSGSDPDDIVTREKADGLNNRLGAAVPLMDFLWRVETKMAPGFELNANKMDEGRAALRALINALKTPEGQAALRAKINTLINSCPDWDIKKAFREDLQQRWQATFYPKGRRVTEVSGSLKPPRPIGEIDLMAPVVARPGILDQIEDEFEALAFSDPGYEACRREIVAWRCEQADGNGDEGGPSLGDSLAMSPHIDVLGEIKGSPVYATCIKRDDPPGDDAVIEAWRRRVAKMAEHHEKRFAVRSMQEALASGDDADIEALWVALQRAVQHKKRTAA